MCKSAVHYQYIPIVVYFASSNPIAAWKILHYIMDAKSIFIVFKAK